MEHVYLEYKKFNTLNQIRGSSIEEKSNLALFHKFNPIQCVRLFFFVEKDHCESSKDVDFYDFQSCFLLLRNCLVHQYIYNNLMKHRMVTRSGRFDY